MGLIRSIDELNYNIEEQNRHKTRLQEVSELKLEYKHLLKQELKSEFYRIANLKVDPINFLIMNDVETIEKVAKDVNFLQKTNKIDTTGWQDKNVIINKYKCYNSVYDDVNDIYFSELNRFKHEFTLKSNIIDHNYYNKAYNYILDGFKKLIQEYNSIIDVFIIFDRDNVKEAYIKDIKDIYNYDLTLAQYDKILRAIKTLYHGNIVIERKQKQQLKQQQKINKKNLIKDNISLPWRILGGFEVLKHFWK